MPSSQDPASKRLLKLLERARIVRAFEEAIFSKLDDTLVHTFHSSAVLRLNEADEADTEMLSAFKVTGLDHRNPRHWRLLLKCFSEAHFGKKKTKPVKWDAFEFCVLLKDYFDLTRNRPELSDLDACKLLKSDKLYKEKYGDYNIHALRKLVRQARSPKYNMYLRHPEMRDLLLQQIRDDWEREGIPWDELFGKQIAEAVRLAMEETTQSKT